MNQLGDLPAAELRRHLHRIADWIADYREGIEERHITPDVEPGALRGSFRSALPEDGVPLEKILDDFERLVVPGVVHWGHPAFLGYFGSTTTAPGIVAEALTAALNVSAMMWQVSPVATELEDVVVQWLRQLVGLPAAFKGLVYDTASVATLHALAAARESSGRAIRRGGIGGGPRLTVYTSDAAHSSINKAAVVLGLGEDAVRRVASDDQQRMRSAALRHAVDADRRAGLQPCAVVATVGTTETAAVDPVPEIAAICAEFGLWLHVDAAYGGALALLEEGRWAMAGVQAAESVVVNPHKWLFVPLDFSALYVKRPEAVRAVFALTPPYLSGDAGEGRFNAMDYNLALGRRFRALKAWMVWTALGANGLTFRIREHVRLAQMFATWVDADSAFELWGKPKMGVVCFRAVFDGPPAMVNQLNASVAMEVNRSGISYLTQTTLKGRTFLRIALGNILTEERHLARAWSAVKAAVATVAAARRPPRADFANRRGAAS